MSLELGYLLLDFFVILAFILFAKKATSSNRKAGIVALSLLLWHIFIFAISQTELLMTYSLPPRLVMFFILPSFIFTGVFFYRNKNREWISNVPEHWLILFQSYRILIETLFYYSVLEGILNEEVTIHGYNYDMLYGATALVIGFYLMKNRSKGRKLALYWNYLGLAVIASIIALFFMSLYNPSVFGSNEPLIPLVAMEFPYVLVASFLMPAAVFLHIWSIVQLKRN